MRDQKERVERMASRLKNDFGYALEINLITQEEHDGYVAELTALTSYIFDKYHDSPAFYDEDWLKINVYYEKVIKLDFLRARTKIGLEDDWLLDM